MKVSGSLEDMMGGGMMFGEVIAFIEGTRLPVDGVVFLRDAIV